MKRILVGMDGSQAAADALEWSVGMGAAVGADVFALHAFAPPYAEVAPDERDRLAAERETQLTAWANAVPGADSVKTVLRSGDPRDVLFAEVEDLGADLVVLGRSGAGGAPGLLHVGSVVEYVAHHNTTPLAVVPEGFRHPPERVVIGIDGSTGSQAAVGWVASLAPLEPRVAMVQVAEPYVEWTAADSPKNWRRDVEHELEKWAEPLTEAGLRVVPIAQRDIQPVDGLLGAATARHADLLVVGARGVGGFTGLRAGGVALKVLHRAGLPVVLVPRD